jgi:hypothetical protein
MMETGTMIAVLTLGVATLTVVIMVVIPLSGFAYKTLNNRITEVKIDAKAEVEAEERRRIDGDNQVLEVVNNSFNVLRTDIQGVRDEIKGLK